MAHDQYVPASREPVIAVVIPSYRVKPHILDVLRRIGPEVHQIIVVDDACPEQSGAYVVENCTDPRVVVLQHMQNKGVGGAVVTGYLYALDQGADIAVKLDGDGQMDPSLISSFVAPIANGQADYVKGNRFWNVEDLRSMPWIRVVGNAALSFATKASSGYWHVFDPTNGYTAVRTSILPFVGLQKLSQRYFFESDLLFRLGLIQACVVDLPMTAVYGTEESGLKISRVIGPFLKGNIGNFCKRLFYNYLLRGFSIATLELVVGVLLLAFGIAFGLYGWTASALTGRPATTGTVMLAALPIIVGVQFLLSFLAFDMSSTPRTPIRHTLHATNKRRLPLPALGSITSCSKA